MVGNHVTHPTTDMIIEHVRIFPDEDGGQQKDVTHPTI